MRYLIDSNIFIESKNSFYAFDICPGFWTWLQTTKEIGSINKVKEELLIGKDELSQWVEDNLSKDFFQQETENIQNQYADIITYVMNLPKEYKIPTKLDFLGGADGWLIATAKIQNLTIITQEVYDTKARRKIFLPVIAEKFGVRCINIFTALREMNVQFH